VPQNNAYLTALKRN